MEGITFYAINRGGTSTTVTLLINGNPVGEMRLTPGEEETFVYDLNPADAGTTLAVQVFHGDVALFDQALPVNCGEFAATPCETTPATAGTPAPESAGSPDTSCTNPCWWAPLALLGGVLIGRRRKNGNLNPAGIAAGGLGGFLALTGLGFAPLAWAGLAAALLGAAVMLFRRRPVQDGSDTTTDEADKADSPETPVEKTETA